MTPPPLQLHVVVACRGVKRVPSRFVARHKFGGELVVKGGSGIRRPGEQAAPQESGADGESGFESAPREDSVTTSRSTAQLMAWRDINALLYHKRTTSVNALTET